MIVAGTDEAGRGPLAGPVVAAAVILTRKQAQVLLDAGMNDSKKLTEKKRELLFFKIEKLGVLWKAQAASNKKIDTYNILQASLWAMRRSVLDLPLKPDLLIVDGTQKIPNLLQITQRPIPKADFLVPAVMAASIVAKVLRDRIMYRLDKIFPGYGLAKHKGYPTKAHRECLAEKGLTAIHRRTFKNGVF